MSKADLLLEKINRAFEFVRSNQNAEAVREFSNALSLTKEKKIIKDICYQLSICHIGLRGYDEAEKNLRRSLTCCGYGEKKDKQRIYALLLQIYKLQNKHDDLRKIYTEIIADKIGGDIYTEAILYILPEYARDKNYAEGLKFIDDIYDSIIENRTILAFKLYFLSWTDNMERVLDEGLDFVKRFGFDYNVHHALARAYSYFCMDGEAYKYFIRVYEALPDEEKEQPSMDSQAFTLLDVIIGHWPYHEECKKEYFLDLLNRRYKTTAAYDKNTDFNTDLGFFKKLKIGYLSPELFSHPVGQFIMPVIKNRNKCSSENICYSLLDPEIKEDQMTEYLKNNASKWYDLYDKNDDELEKFVLADKPDIMLELTSLSIRSKLKLYARRLAPLQVSWIGFPVSTGVKAVDYVITDKYADPPGLTEDYYTEKLLYLADTFLCHLPIYSNKVDTIPYLKNGFITFGCFNNCTKITDRMLSNWNRILQVVENSKLLLKSSFYDNRKTLELLQERMIKLGFDMGRVSFEAKTDFDLYLNKYNEVDILLDTFPFNGATTTFDAFEMGVPLIALIGETHASRVSLGMLANVGLEDLAVYTDQDYVNKAAELAADTDRLVKIKSTLRDTKMKSKLSDVKAFRTEYEHAMRRIWIDYCKKNRKHPVYGGLSPEELSNSLVNGSYYIIKLLEDNAGLAVDEILYDEYINLQRVFTRKLGKLWADDSGKNGKLGTYGSIANLVYKIKSLSDEDVCKLLNMNIKFILGNDLA